MQYSGFIVSYLIDQLLTYALRNSWCRKLCYTAFVMW